MDYLQVLAMFCVVFEIVSLSEKVNLENPVLPYII